MAWSGRGQASSARFDDLNLAARYADRVPALMSRGPLAALAPTREVLQAELLSRVYEHPVTVVPHPAVGDCPLVLPLGGGAAAAPPSS